jgi:hypothetical protein
MSFEAFKNYLSGTQMTFSYKPVLVAALLDVVDRDGKTTSSRLIDSFREFYLDRLRRGLPTEKERGVSPSPMLKPDEISDEQIWNILVRYPLELMKEFIQFDNEIVRIQPIIWKQLTSDDLIQLKQITQQRIEKYYKGIK